MTIDRIEMANGWYWVPFRRTDSVDRGCGGWLMRPDGQASASIFAEDARAFAASLQQQQPQAPAADWKPIASVPHDVGEQVWLRAPGAQPAVWEWDPDDNRWQRGNGLHWAEGEYGPEEWMPVFVPAAPTPDQGSKERYFCSCGHPIELCESHSCGRRFPEADMTSAGSASAEPAAPVAWRCPDPEGDWTFFTDHELARSYATTLEREPEALFGSFADLSAYLAGAPRQPSDALAVMEAMGQALEQTLRSGLHARSLAIVNDALAAFRAWRAGGGGANRAEAGDGG